MVVVIIIIFELSIDVEKDMIFVFNIKVLVQTVKNLRQFNNQRRKKINRFKYLKKKFGKKKKTFVIW